MKKSFHLFLVLFVLLFPNLALAVEGKCIEGDCENGQGTYTLSDGTKYVGEHKNGQSNGHGTFTSSWGMKYVGEFREGKYHGQGNLTLPDGSNYVGEFKDNFPNGQGIFTFSDGALFVGEFREGKYHGQGNLTLPDGSNYVGAFKDSLPNGQGTMTYPDGSQFVGEFKDGAPYRKELKLELGQWAVVEYTNGTNGAHFESSNIELKVYQRPGQHENTLRLTLAGDKHLMAGDQVVLSFDYNSPELPEFSHYWDNIAVETYESDSGKVTTTSLTASAAVIKKMKEGKDLFIHAGVKEDFSRGYAVYYRIPLKGSSGAIEKAITTNEDPPKEKNKPLDADDDTFRWITSAIENKIALAKQTLDKIDSLGKLKVPYSTHEDMLSAIAQVTLCVDEIAPSVQSESIGTAIMLCCMQMKFL